MKKHLISLIAVTALLLVVAIPWLGGASSANAAGCQAFGQETATEAQTNIPLGSLVKDLATSGPGAVAEIVSFEMGELCD
ncbi:MAG: hypothetical protein HY664_07735 [Chloroflexi bacterium]|nr:hypothetical protein [Chloroflexota bacterium]